MRRLTTSNSAPARFSATTVIACVALALSGVAVGLMLGRWTAAPAQTSEHEGAAISPQTDLTPVLAQVQRSTDTVLQALRDGRDPGAPRESSRESAVTSADGLQRLTTAVEKLNGLLERNALGAGRYPAAADVSKGPGYPSLDALWQKIDSMAASADPDLQSKVNSELTRAHLSWMNEDLIQRYGACSQVLGSKPITVTYKRPLEAGRPNSVSFTLTDGVILRVSAD